MTGKDRIKSYLEDHEKQIVNLLEEMVCIQSGTLNRAGVNQVGTLVCREMAQIGFTCTIDEQEKYGNHIIARSPGFNRAQKQILITGHMDTVFPHDTRFDYFKQDKIHRFGPGVADMKGGLVVGIFALKALFECHMLPDTNICFVFNSDEEVGSPSSRGVIQEQAKKSFIGLVLEAGGLNKQIVTGRKGNMSARLSITGRAGHAAFAGTNKASAILELAHKIIEIEKLNQPEKGLSANVGTVEGGIGPNTVPDNAIARMDFRFLAPDDFTMLKSRLNTICDKQNIKGTNTEFEIISSRPPMPETKSNIDLFNLVKAIAHDLQYQVASEIRQGVSDANLIAGCGVPVLDGLGPIGAKDHSEDEYIITQSLLDRTQLFAHMIEGLGNNLSLEEK